MRLSRKYLKCGRSYPTDKSNQEGDIVKAICECATLTMNGKDWPVATSQEITRQPDGTLFIYDHQYLETTTTKPNHFIR